MKGNLPSISSLSLEEMLDEKRKQLRFVWELNLDFVLRKDEKVRLCYWLCCLFPRDCNIPIEDLALYGMCLKLFKDVDSLFEARLRVHAIVDELKHEMFLIDGEEDDYGNKCVKMVYDVPDFLIPIISKYNLEITRETLIKKWPESDRYKDCIAISLDLKDISEYPFSLDCPQLRLLKLKFRKKVPIHVFEGMKGLRVLSLDIPSVLPQSFVVLKQLRALYVKVFKWENMSEIGGLKNLEILSISIVRLTDIPEEMGLLFNLRLLDLRNTNIARFPQGVLSRMIKLEELYLPLSFSRWGCKPKVENGFDNWESGEEYGYGIDGENINAGLIDIVSLPLTTLQITVRNASVLPFESLVFKKLKRFKILVKGNLRYRPFGKGSMNELQLRGDISNIKASGICGLLHMTEELCLTKVRNLGNVVNQLKGGDYPCLKKMLISECDELECIFDIKPPSFPWLSTLESLHLSMLCNLKEIWRGKWPDFSWFNNLSQINVRLCHKLKYVFPLSIWPNRGLLQLQSVEIHQCNEMKGIFCRDKRDDREQDIYFPEELHLYSLPKLVGFLVEKDNILRGIHDDHSSNHIVSLLKNEQNKIYNASSSKRLGSLKKLKIAYCNALKVIFSPDKYHAASSLEELELYGLQSLVHIWFKFPPDELIAFQLQTVVLSECHNLYLFSSSMARLLVKLRKIHIMHCQKMAKIVSVNNDMNVRGLTKIIFPELKVLELNNMPSLENFYGGTCTIVFPSLEILKLNQCNRMVNFSYWPPEVPMLVDIQINNGQYLGTKDLNAAMKDFSSSSRQEISEIKSTPFITGR